MSQEAASKHSGAKQKERMRGGPAATKHLQGLWTAQKDSVSVFMNKHETPLTPDSLDCSPVNKVTSSCWFPQAGGALPTLPALLSCLPRVQGTGYCRVGHQAAPSSFFFLWHPAVQSLEARSQRRKLRLAECWGASRLAGGTGSLLPGADPRLGRGLVFIMGRR